VFLFCFVCFVFPIELTCTMTLRIGNICFWGYNLWKEWSVGRQLSRYAANAANDSLELKSVPHQRVRNEDPEDGELDRALGHEAGSEILRAPEAYQDAVCCLGNSASPSESWFPKVKE